jgi:hypothetical protein
MCEPTAAIRRSLGWKEPTMPSPDPDALAAALEDAAIAAVTDCAIDLPLSDHERDSAVRANERTKMRERVLAAVARWYVGSRANMLTAIEEVFRGD